MAVVKLSVSAWDAMFKEMYPAMRQESLAIRNRPLLEMIQRSDEFYGDNVVVPVLHEDPQGRSATYATARANSNTSKQVKFTHTTRYTDYGVVTLEAEAMKASSRNAGAFLEAKQVQVDGMLRNLGKSLHYSLYRSGSGSLARASAVSTGSNGTVTLTNASDSHAFGVGQVVIANANETGNSGTIRTAATVTKVNHSSGIITFDTVPAAWAADDYLYTEGDYDSKITGLAGWLPLSAPGATAFKGVDRTVNIAALGGHRVDNSGRSILENAEELGMFIGEFGGEPDVLLLNPRAGLQLSEQVGAKVERVDMEGKKAVVGFRGFELVNFITGPIKVVFDIGCPVNRGYMLQLDSWKLLTMGSVPHMIGEDGLMLRRGDADDYRIEARYWADLSCHAPGFNGVMSVAT